MYGEMHEGKLNSDTYLALHVCKCSYDQQITSPQYFVADCKGRNLASISVAKPQSVVVKSLTPQWEGTNYCTSHTLLILQCFHCISFTCLTSSKSEGTLREHACWELTIKYSMLSIYKIEWISTHKFMIILQHVLKSVNGSIHIAITHNN